MAGQLDPLLLADQDRPPALLITPSDSGTFLAQATAARVMSDSGSRVPRLSTTRIYVRSLLPTKKA
jgi:hypothetical protein